MCILEGAIVNEEDLAGLRENVIFIYLDLLLVSILFLSYDSHDDI